MSVLLSDFQRNLTKSARYGLCQRKGPEIKCQETGPLRTGLPIGHGFFTRLWMDNNDPPRMEEIRTALCESIIEKIIAGETDPKQIRKLALDNVFLGEWLGKH